MLIWSDETTIIESSNIDFYLRCFKHCFLRTIDDLSLIEVQENEFRRDDNIYYSRIVRYRLLGYLLPNKEHILNKYFLCTSCFQKVDNYKICAVCETNFEEKEKPFFLNCNYFTQFNLYNTYKNRYDLGIIEEFIRDQRSSICNPLKDEILMNALHPKRIQRILDLTDDLENLDNYI
jgi:hypothetical protein